MKVLFISNYMNHHQIGLCDELNRIVGNGNFYFVAQNKMNSERTKLGYLDYNSSRDYIVKEYECGTEYTNELIGTADVIIITFSQGVRPIRKAQKEKKIIFWYQERLFKDYDFLRTVAKFFRAKYYFEYIADDNQYFLNASAYGSHDLKILNKRKYQNKAFTFGYFPDFDFDEKIVRSTGTKFTILFVGRLLKWKHPEYVFDCADILDKKGIDYHIDIVGDGELRESISKAIRSKKLEDKISLIGPIRNDKVKEYYASHDVLLFASDKREGWGAVLNEAMLYGCVPLANKLAGATCNLIADGVNGFVFLNKRELKESCISLCNMKKSGMLAEIARNNRSMIKNIWNYKVAAQRLYNVMNAIIHNEDYKLYETNELMGIQDDKK